MKNLAAKNHPLSARSLKLLALGAAAIFVMAAGSASAEDWGTLKGQFIFDGKPPAEKKLTLTQDIDYCSKPPAPVEENLVVGPKGGLANVLVWVRTKVVPVNPEYAKSATEAVVLDNNHCRFEPHVLAMRNTQKLTIKNSDTMGGHNTNIGFNGNNNPAFNSIVPAGQEMQPPISKPEAIPVPVSCTIHKWMTGWLLVRPDPYFAVSDKDGKFEIKNLPAGKELEFQVWQESSGNVSSAKMGGKDAGWEKGRFKMTIKPGDNDLGEIKLDPKQFDK